MSSAAKLRSSAHRRRNLTLAAVAALGVTAAAGLGAAAPSVASMNLCTDQLVLLLADEAQIRTLSWLSADPQESMLAAQASRFPLNYGTAEEVLRLEADVVLAGAFTNAFARALLRELGYEVIDIAPAESVADIESNIRRVAAAVARPERGEELIETMRERLEQYRTRPDPPVRAVVLRPGGFTVEPQSLAHELMLLAGLANVPAAQGLDRWGSLSIEGLIRSAPELLIVAAYRIEAPALANTVFTHPAVGALHERSVTAVVPAAQWSCGLPSSLDAVDAMRRAAAQAISRRGG